MPLTRRNNWRYDSPSKPMRLLGALLVILALLIVLIYVRSFFLPTGSGPGGICGSASASMSNPPTTFTVFVGAFPCHTVLDGQPKELLP